MIPGRYDRDFNESWNGVRGTIEEVINHLNGRNMRTALPDKGLYGVQLKLKAQVAKDDLNRAIDFHMSEKMSELPGEKSHFKKWWSYCKRFLQSSNIVVGSLVGVLPYAEPIREGIETIIHLSEQGTE
jgi:hypothetical protein